MTCWWPCPQQQTQPQEQITLQEQTQPQQQTQLQEPITLQEQAAPEERTAKNRITQPLPISRDGRCR